MCGCSKNNGITAPRPYPVQLPRFQKPVIKTICKQHSPSQPKPFEPIDDDVCHCGNQRVKPAPMPRVRPTVSFNDLLNELKSFEFILSFSSNIACQRFSSTSLHAHATAAPEETRKQNILKIADIQSELHITTNITSVTVHQSTLKQRKNQRKFQIFSTIIIIVSLLFPFSEPHQSQSTHQLMS